jgi:hypothetical protein
MNKKPIFLLVFPKLKITTKVYTIPSTGSVSATQRVPSRITIMVVTKICTCNSKFKNPIFSKRKKLPPLKPQPRRTMQNPQVKFQTSETEKTEQNKTKVETLTRI